MKKRVSDSKIYEQPWLIARDFDVFCDMIEDHFQQITHVSFDHDLGEDRAQLLRKEGFSKSKARQSKKGVKDGYDCAVWMKEFYAKKGLILPIVIVHSMNPIGTERIKRLFNG